MDGLPIQERPTVSLLHFSNLISVFITYKIKANIKINPIAMLK